jgi:hypothetical protein
VAAGISGASLIGVEDSAANFAGAEVEAVLAEIIADYALTTSGNGASKIGIEDSATQITATNVETALAEIFSTFQRGVATLSSGTVTVGTTITVNSGSRILVSHKGRPTGSTNYAGLAVISRTVGGPATGDFVIEAIVAAGTIDADAAGDVDWMIID